MFASWRAKRRLDQVIRSWITFRRVMQESYSSGHLTSRQEKHFLKLNARIATQLQLLTNSVPTTLTGETYEHIESMNQLLMIHLSMKSNDSESDWDQEEFDHKWHEHYLYLNKLKSVQLVLKQPSKRSDPSVPSGIDRKRISRSMQLRDFGRVFAGLGLLAFIILLVGWGLGLRLGEGGKLSLSGKPIFYNMWMSVNQTVNSLWSDIIQFFTPVISLYGPAITVVLIGILLLTIGYWLFVRI